MATTQLDLINQYLETIKQFERELLWGVNITSLQHYVHKIGRLFVAIGKSGQVVDKSNSLYDVVTIKAEKYKVITITDPQKTDEVNITLNSLNEATRVSVVLFDTNAFESFEILDLSTKNFLSLKSSKSGDKVVIKLPEIKKRDSDRVVYRVTLEDYEIVEFESGYFEVSFKGSTIDTMKGLKKVAGLLDIPQKRGMVNISNSRELGTIVINRLRGDK